VNTPVDLLNPQLECPVPRPGDTSTNDQGPDGARALGKALESAPGLEAHAVTIGPGFATPQVFKAVGSAWMALLWLLSHAAPDDTVGTTLEGIAKGVGISRSSVKAALRRLKEAGFITIHGTRKGLIVGVRLSPYFSGVPVENSPHPADPQPPEGQESVPLQPTTPPGDRNPAPPNRFSLAVDLYKELCESRGIQPRLTHRERTALFLFLQRHPRLKATEIAQALRKFSTLVEGASFRLSVFVRESEAELGGSGLSRSSKAENRGGTSRE
jgi:DNA-binding transcriptional ArsR family regulator